MKSDIATTNPISIAPMMGYTDRHYRYMMRLITRHTLLYTEMLTSKALIHGKQLEHHFEEQPLALQVGGSDPTELEYCSQLAEQHGFCEINLNVGCPSDRVQAGRFGACLMAEPLLVAKCVSSMKKKTQIPVSVKTRIGINDKDDYESLHYFIKCIQEAGCDKVIIHARKAWLKGLSPKENREIPPLRYDRVYQLKNDFPTLPLIINGGIKSWQEAYQHLKFVDGIMIGREAFANPYLFAEADKRFYNPLSKTCNREQIINLMHQYFLQPYNRNTPLTCLIKPLLNLYQGVTGAKTWRKMLSDSQIQSIQKSNILDFMLKQSIQFIRI